MSLISRVSHLERAGRGLLGQPRRQEVAVAKTGVCDRSGERWYAFFEILFGLVEGLTGDVGLEFRIVAEAREFLERLADRKPDCREAAIGGRRMRPNREDVARIAKREAFFEFESALRFARESHSHVLPRRHAETRRRSGRVGNTRVIELCIATLDDQAHWQAVARPDYFVWRALRRVGRLVTLEPGTLQAGALCSQRRLVKAGVDLDQMFGRHRTSRRTIHGGRRCGARTIRSAGPGRARRL